MLELFTRVCISLCTSVIHNTAQNSSDYLPSYPPNKHHSSDAVSWRGGGVQDIYLFTLSQFICSTVHQCHPQTPWCYINAIIIIIRLLLLLTHNTSFQSHPSMSCSWHFQMIVLKCKPISLQSLASQHISIQLLPSSQNTVQAIDGVKVLHPTRHISETFSAGNLVLPSGHTQPSSNKNPPIDLPQTQNKGM